MATAAALFKGMKRREKAMLENKVMTEKMISKKIQDYNEQVIDREMEEYGYKRSDLGFLLGTQYTEKSNPYTQIQKPVVDEKQHLMGKDLCNYPKSIFEDREHPI